MSKKNTLPPHVLNILDKQGTEMPGSGRYNLSTEAGSYLCRQCGLCLFRSTAKFISACGWPSFDEAMDHSIKYLKDKDGTRTEIRCGKCEAHLGHVFYGEAYTPSNQRYCVNSLALDLVKSSSVEQGAEALLAGGCFWGIEHLLKQGAGVIFTEVGYSGGHTLYPSYDSICEKNTGHFETTRIIYDPNVLSYEQLIKVFLEIHDPAQIGGQGHDIGPQYESAIFFYNEQQQQTAQALIHILEENNLQVSTQVLPAGIFWAAEEIHQEYLHKHPGTYSCHTKVKRFP